MITKKKLLSMIVDQADQLDFYEALLIGLCDRVDLLEHMHEPLAEAYCERRKIKVKAKPSKAKKVAVKTAKKTTKKKA